MDRRGRQWSRAEQLPEKVVTVGSEQYTLKMERALLEWKQRTYKKESSKVEGYMGSS